MIILIFFLLWFFASFVLWYLYHILNKVSRSFTDEPSFMICLVLFPITIICFIYELGCFIDKSNIGDRIKARLDKFFGI